ncbi:hypothetical protein D020_2781 [Vibrio parahaemolyticus SBR10290]|nr:hypothetical protein D052_3034 [Vibrio parahaemolyticus 10290]ESV69421.1 hypothetical protein D021_1424 [Vibrio parahaemolyticus 10296]ESW45070.1 hypothetical protein D022_1413 [Vibrio parahaemolyticus 12310]ETT21288.1 hypothetical protein D023_1717 [Vibrio parahaemolyticus 3256]ETX53743.1 hypothetical protein D020_2781 [Vibrio parahaemolyticus SBR10290]EVU18712.1 hypothetical protein D046_2054 [Vibrio parahaemolyticus V-223/04]
MFIAVICSALILCIKVKFITNLVNEIYKASNTAITVP